MKIVDDARVARFVGERVGSIIVPPFTAMGIERDGGIIAGVVFNCFTGPDIEATVAGEARAFNRQFFREVHRYVFGQLGCIRISATTENPTVVRLAERMGGRLEGLRQNLFGEGRDGFLVGVLKEDWRYK